MTDIVVFGIGGVGSWLVDFLTKLPEGHKYCFRDNTINTLHLVDFDRVEEKNVLRQNYDNNDAGTLKVDAMAERLERKGRFNVRRHYMKVEKLMDIVNLDRGMLAIICTDNTQSKRLIASYFPAFVICNCEQDYYEIKNSLDEDEQNALVIDSGYSSTQTFLSNILCAANIYKLIEKNKIENRSVCEKVAV